MLKSDALSLSLSHSSHLKGSAQRQSTRGNTRPRLTAAGRMRLLLTRTARSRCTHCSRSPLPRPHPGTTPTRRRAQRRLRGRTEGRRYRRVSARGQRRRAGDSHNAPRPNRRQRHALLVLSYDPGSALEVPNSYLGPNSGDTQKTTARQRGTRWDRERYRQCLPVSDGRPPSGGRSPTRPDRITSNPHHSRAAASMHAKMMPAIVQPKPA